jgi:hypothetical protein
MPEPLPAQPAAAPAPPPANIGKAKKDVPKASGPTCIVNVPSAALRSGPSLSAKALKAIVRQDEKVQVLKRVASTSGPDWIQIVTTSGRTGWVWASVLRDAKMDRPG